MCTNSSDQDLLSGKFLKRICNSVLERASSEECEPLFGALRRVFVPSIDQRVFGLVSQVFSDPCCCGPGRQCRSCGDDSAPWIELIDEMNRVLACEAVGRMVRDAVLITERIDRIGCELDRMACEVPEFDACDDSSGRCLSTSCKSCLPKEKICQTKPSRKRKACCIEQPEPIQRRSSPPCPPNVPLKTTRCGGCQTDVETCNPNAKCAKETGKRADKQCLVVVEDNCPKIPCNTKCRRTDYDCLPLQSETLKEKVCEDSAKNVLKCCQKSTNLNERFKNIGSCVNRVTTRISEEQISQTSLSCDLRKNCVRFKVEAAKGKECRVASRLPMQDASCQKQLCRKPAICSTTQRPSCEKLPKICCVGVGTNESSNSCREIEDNTDCSSPRFLWNNQCDSFNTTASSLSNSSVFSSEQISSFNCNLNTKCSKTRLICEPQSRKMSSLAEYKKCCQEQDKSNCKSSSKCSSPKTVSVKITSSGKSPKCQEVQAVVEKTEGRCLSRKVSWTDKQTCTEEVDDTIELTNIYINEISFCYCNGEEESAREIGINTECLESRQCSVSVDISTNTERVSIVESSTQAFFKDKKDCCCDRRDSGECELRSFRFDDTDIVVGCKCDKVTTTDAKCRLIDARADVPKSLPCQSSAALDLAMQSWSSAFSEQSQFTSVIRSKIGEIVDLNRKMREKMSNMREAKDLCSVSVQTLSRRGSCPRSKNLVQVKLKSSLLSIKPDCPKKLTSCKSVATEMSGRRIPKCGQTCNEHKNSLDKCSVKRRSIGSFDSYRAVRPPRCTGRSLPTVQESDSLGLTVSSSFCSIVGNFDRGDFEEMYLLNYPRRRDERRPSRCSKKSNFLNYVSEHLTRDTFERCKKLLRSMLGKFLEGARRLGEYRRRGSSRCRCRECRCAERLAELRPDCAGDSSGSSRLWAGADAPECPSACRVRSRARYARRPDDKAARVRSTTDCRDHRPEGRKKRHSKHVPVAPPWKKPYDIYEASSGSMPLSDSWK